MASITTSVAPRRLQTATCQMCQRQSDFCALVLATNGKWGRRGKVMRCSACRLATAGHWQSTDIKKRNQDSDE